MMAVVSVGHANHVTMRYPVYAAPNTANTQDIENLSVCERYSSISSFCLRFS